MATTAQDIVIRRPTQHNARPQTMIEIPADEEYGHPALIVCRCDDGKIGFILDGLYDRTQNFVGGNQRGYQHLMGSEQTKLDYSPRGNGSR